MIALLQAQNEVIRGGERDELRRYEFVSLDPSRAVLTVCWLDFGERYDAQTGQLLTNGQPGLSGGEITLVREDGVWKVLDQVERQESCAGVSA